MKRSPIAKKRTVKRRTTMPRCVIRGCTNIARIQDLCKKHAMAKADRLARKIVMQRDVVCRCATHEWVDDDNTVLLPKCSGSLQWCHVWSRSYHAIRHDPRNAIVMCAAHHAYFTHHPAQWEQWCRDHGIAWDSLRLEALHGAASWSLAETLERLSPSQQEGAG